MRTILANLAGLSVLAVESILFLALPLCRSISLPIEFLGYFVPAGGALYVWHSSKLPTSTPAGWLGLAAASIVGGSISFVIDAFIGSSVIHGPAHSFLDAAEHAGSPFGFPLTILICPCLTMIAVAGCVRSLILPTQEADL